MLQIKRIYEPPVESDGVRILVDRLWPRGVSKEKAHLDFWLKEVAPSPELRAWFNHEPGRFAEFSEKYIAELSENPAIKQLEDLVADNPRLTLLYGTKDPKLNHAMVLREFLKK